MDDALSMGGLQRVDQLRGKPQRGVHRQAAAHFEVVAQRTALQVVHDHEVVVVLDANVDDAHDVRVLQAPGRTRLALEARHDILIVDQVPVKHLDDYKALHARLKGPVDFGHSALCHALDQFIFAQFLSV